MTTDSRAVLLSHDMAEAIDHGARLLTTLAALERAWMLGDEDALASIFDGIDPIEVQLTASTLHSLTFLWHAMPPQIRGGTDGASQAGSDATAVVSPSPLSVTAAASGGEQPSAPVTPLASRRAPCS